MSDTPKAYKLNKEKRAAEENGKFLYYFYDRKKLTSVALPEEQFDKLVEMDREYYNLERREHDHKTTFKKSANTNGYKKIDLEKDDFGQASEEDPDDDDVSGADFTYKIHKQCDIDKKVALLSPDDRTIYQMYYVDGFRQAEIAEELGKTQGYVAKRLMKIGDALQENKTDIRSCAVIGCGNVGATTAYSLMQSGLLSKLILIDINEKKAQGEADDIAHALPFNAPMEIKAGKYSDISDCGIIVITAGANQQPGETRIQLVDKNVKIFRNIIDNVTKYNKDAIILAVTHTPVLTRARL